MENILNFFILLFNHIAMTNPLIYWSIHQYYNSPLPTFTEVISQQVHNQDPHVIQAKTSQDRDNVRSHQGAKRTPV